MKMTAAAEIDEAMAAIWLVERPLPLSSPLVGAAVEDDDAEAEAEEKEDVEDVIDEVDEDVEEDLDDVFEEVEEDLVEVERVEDVLDEVGEVVGLLLDIDESNGVGTLLGHCVTGTAIVWDGVMPSRNLPSTMGWSPPLTQP